jgi:Flp pilus assembly secretin CpaC
VIARLRQRWAARRRLRGERGVATVTGLVLLFAFTAGAVVWLARDVNRTVGNRSAAQSIAFQAARSGAQQVDVDSLRDGGSGEVVIDESRAEAAARATATLLFEDYRVDGAVVAVRFVDADGVEVEVRIDDPAGDVTGIASARAETGP